MLWTAAINALLFPLMRRHARDRHAIALRKKSGLALFFSAALLATTSDVHAQDAKAVWEEYGKKIGASARVSGLGNDLFGDQVSLSNGALSFLVTDVELKGNNALTVAFSRSFTVRDSRGYYVHNDFPLRDWEIDLPNISGIFAPNWISPKSGLPGERCTATAPQHGRPPNLTVDLDVVQAHDFWHGAHLHIPGKGGGELLFANTSMPAPGHGGPFYWVTNDLTRLGCTPSIQNWSGGGEGFIAVTTDGTRYRFDWMAQYLEPSIITTHLDDLGGAVVAHERHSPRRRNVLYPTQVMDRHGNTVTYTYGNAWNQPLRLNSIRSSDGRAIDITHHPDGSVSTVRAGDRVWTYEYAQVNSVDRSLDRVVQPDETAWEIDFTQLLQANVEYQVAEPGNPHWRSCVRQPELVDPDRTYSGTMIHPSGAVGVFTVGVVKHGRTHVPVLCENFTMPHNEPATNISIFPLYYHSLSILSKRISGPGIDPLQWNYAYDSPHSFFYPSGNPQSPVCNTGADCSLPRCTSEDCSRSSMTTVTSSGGEWTRHKYGNSYRYNEGKLLGVETGFSSDTPIRTNKYEYDFSQLDRVYPAKWGTSARQRHTAFTSEFFRPLVKSSITQQGETFSERVDLFDYWARPKEVRKASSLGYERTEVNVYYDDLPKWVVGLIGAQSTNGIESSRTDYWPNTALPMRTWVFGKLQHSLDYYADGTLKTVTDGRSHTTTLSNWKLGIPQLIQYPPTPDQPAGVSQSAVVNDRGEIDSVIDENGYKTCYTYDVTGRLAGTTYPSESQAGTCDTSFWNATTRDFARVSARYGLPDHWRSLVKTGNGWKIVRYDALWRPVIEEAFDAPIADATRSFVVKRYDSSGRLAFQSYPQRTLTDYATVTTGVHTYYDALDRPTLVRQTSELGHLDTTTQYLPGFKTRVTSPKHQGANPAVYTETSYQAWDQPTTEFPVMIQHPESAQTHLFRDAFGKPISILRRDNAGTQQVARHYVYDAHHRLCKTIEPETHATVMGFDAAGNLSWSAGGLGLPSGTDCNTSEALNSGRVVHRGYDARNRLRTLRFPDTRGDQDWSYTPDSLPVSITTVNVPGAVHPINQYVYNRRRMLVSETQHLPAWYSYLLGYNYDRNGSLKRINYPSTDFVDFAPNALGQPTQAVGSGRTYASNVSYWPNGAIKGFTYGNGVAHAMEQNARQLPLRTNSQGVQKYEIHYDKNGNPDAIFDQTRGNHYTRDPVYDGLDRLTAVGSASFGGDHWHRFTYDALDNLVTWKHGGVKDHRYCYNVNNRLEHVRTGATACNNGAMADWFAYDVQGNVEVHDNRGFDFDYGNRLREVIDVERYRYDAHGRRILAMNYASGTVFSQYSQSGQLLYQKNTRTGQNKHIDHIYLAGSLIAQREQPIGETTVTTKYLHTDALGSPVAVTNHSNPLANIERMEYEPYGKQMASTASIGQDRPGYTGHVRDAATGMLYAQQRYLHEDHPVFLSVDPVTALSNPMGQFHRYRYANNNPYKFTDPDGRNPKLVRPLIKILRNGGDIRAALKDTKTEIVDSVVTILDGTSSPVDKAAAVFNLVSPASTGELSKGSRFLRNQLQGAVGEADKAKSLGSKLSGRQVTIETSTGSRTRVDFVTNDKGVVEVKTGGARASQGQRDLQNDLAAGRTVTPRGANAEAAGLRPNEPIRMTWEE